MAAICDRIPNLSNQRAEKSRENFLVLGGLYFLDTRVFRIGVYMGRNGCSGDCFRYLVVWFEDGKPYEFLLIKEEKAGDHELCS